MHPTPTSFWFTCFVSVLRAVRPFSLPTWRLHNLPEPCKDLKKQAAGRLPSTWLHFLRVNSTSWHPRLATALFAFCPIIAVSQPFMGDESQKINVDQESIYDVTYDKVGRGPSGGLPTIWQVGSSLSPRGNERLLRPTRQRALFNPLESINESSVVHQETLFGTVFYGMGLISYRAESYSPNDACCWKYTTLDDPTAFNGLKEAIVGVRISAGDGFHYGWIRMTRPVIDNHTLFEVTGWNWNPIPNAAIPAGEPPPLPPIELTVDNEGHLTLRWDNRIGEMVLESALSLVPPVDWKPVENSGWPPVTVSFEGSGHFFRLRRP